MYVPSIFLKDVRTYVPAMWRKYISFDRYGQKNDFSARKKSLDSADYYAMLCYLIKTAHYYDHLLWDGILGIHQPLPCATTRVTNVLFSHHARCDRAVIDCTTAKQATTEALGSPPPPLLFVLSNRVSSCDGMVYGFGNTSRRFPSF
jgi:hypothetical protein